MAKIGIELGEKIQIADKSYRTLNDVVDVKEVFGALTFGRIEEQDLIYEDDTTAQRGADGRFPQVATGEVRGVVVSLRSANQSDALFVTIVDQSLEEIEALGLEYRKPVELENIVLTMSNIGRNDNFKVFASKIFKGQVKQEPQNQNKQQKEQKHEKHEG